MPNISEFPDLHDLIGRLNPWLAEVVPQVGSIIKVEKITIGQSNPTYRLLTDCGRFVLRMQPYGKLLPLAHAVDREYRVMNALRNTNVPVPTMIALSMDTDIIGVKFFLMEEVKGKTIMSPVLASVNPNQRAQFYRAQVDVLVALAMVDPNSCGLTDFGKPNGYLERQIAIWTKQYRISETEEISDMEFLIDTLPDNMRSDDTTVSIVHGDFRIDNLIMTEGKKPVVAALIDWELSTLGSPFVDLSYWCAMLRMPSHWPIGGLGGLDRDALHIMQEESLIDYFCAHTGLTKPGNWDMWISFQLFRFAAILQGIRKRHLDGNASASNAGEVGHQAEAVAALGASILRKYLANN